MKNQIQRELEIFAAALKLSNEDARRDYLDQTCAGDPELRQRVDALLQAHEQANTFLQEPAGGARPQGRESLDGFLRSEEPGDRIGRYKLLQVVGEGGMGVVYMAEQEEPVRRRVALKIIKLGMDTRQVVARFEAERQALALMDHPNIAKVLDGGATETGRPYFVMELVQGVPITQFCDKNKLPATERLKLFMQVCQAIQSAHQKGIIHRDIKPSNVLVTLHDGVPVPKVIDFGIAKATHQKLTEKTLFTNFATMIGTPAYMSPEQAEMSGLDIDTRTDVYALGVLLYELLTGTTPFPEKRLRSLAYGEMQRVILEEEPERPSTRLSTMANEQKTAVAKSHNEELASLSRVLKGDLDWIVMKCLEKDRGRRYETANAVAADLKRHLENEPVTARPPSMAYRFQKMARRNKLAFGAVATVAVALLLGVAVSSWQAIRATRAEQQQSLLRSESEKARNAETKQRSVAEQRLYDSLVREARAVRLARRVGYRDQVFDLLRQAVSVRNVQANSTELRNEAIACLGDFVGTKPATVKIPANAIMTDTEFDPSGEVAALSCWSEGSKQSLILLHRFPQGTEVGHFEVNLPVQRICFLATNRLALLLRPSQKVIGPVQNRQGVSETELSIWAAANPSAWLEISRKKMPGAYRFIQSKAGVRLAIDDAAAGLFRMTDLETGKVLFEMPGPHEGFPPRAEASGDGTLVAVQNSNYQTNSSPICSIINAITGEKIRTIPLEKGSVVYGLSEHGEFLALHGYDDNYLAIRDLRSGKTILEIPDMISINTMFVPNQSLVAIPMLHHKQTRLFDFDRHQIDAVLDEPETPVGVRVAPDGHNLISITPSAARFYQLAAGNEVLHLKAHREGAIGFFHPDGKTITSSGSDSDRVTDSMTGQLVKQISNEPIQIWRCSPDGKLLLAGLYGSQRMIIYEPRSLEPLLKLGSSDPGEVHCPTMSRNGEYAVACVIKCDFGTALMSTDTNLGYLAAWQFQPNSKGNPPSVLTNKSLPGKYLSSVFLGSSSKVAFTDFALESSVYVWDVAGTNLPTRLGSNLSWGTQNLSASADGSRLWAVDASASLSCIDSSNGNVISKLAPQRGFDVRDKMAGAGWYFQLSPNEQWIAISVQSERAVDIIEVKTGQIRYTLPIKSGAVWQLSWSPDNARLAVSLSSGDISVWNLAEVDRTLAGLGLGMNAISHE